MPESNLKLDVDYLKSHCGSTWSRITVLPEVGSTNDWIKVHNKNKSVCLAESQTQGRGRNGGSWSSPDAENIYLSFAWSFPLMPKHLPLLSLWVGMVVAKAIKSLGIRDHGIKWPNDLYWQHKKLGGILIETSSASAQVVVGIGLNVNVLAIDAVDQPWTSLGLIADSKIDRNEFLVLLLNSLYSAMDAFADLEAEEILVSWNEWDLINNKSITFIHNNQQCEGLAKGIDNSGYLLVELESGETQAFNTSISKVRW